MRKYLVNLLAIGTLLAFTHGFAQSPLPDYLQLTRQISHNTNLSTQAIETALTGYEWALIHGQVHNKNIITIVDFTISSAKQRLYVINLTTGKVIMALHVTHGKYSGADSAWATSFSNANNSLKSSIGVFVTENSYVGKHGFSLRINGLEASNNNALKRAVVVHGANYVAPEYIRKYGRAGNSWGCFAVNPKKIQPLINIIKNGTILYAYGNSSEYLTTSKIFNLASISLKPTAGDLATIS